MFFPSNGKGDLDGIMATAWDVSTAVYAEKYRTVGGTDSKPYGVSISQDGSKIYMMGDFNTSVFQYNLSTPWDLSTAVYADKYKNIGAQDYDPHSVTFSIDGSKMYVMGNAFDSVFQYTLSTPWDVSTATYAEKLKDVSSQDNDPRDVKFSSDGLKMYILGTAHDRVYQYTLSTPWDVSTATYATKNKYYGPEDSDCWAFTMSSNGSKMYIVGRTLDRVYQYELSTPWDVSIAVYAEKYASVGGQDGNPFGLVFGVNGRNMYIMGYSTDTIYQYSLPNGVATGQPFALRRRNRYLGGFIR